jgi:hypothetical protein
MKRVQAFILLLTFGSATFVGCGSSKNASKDIFGSSKTVTGTVVKSVATIVGVILLTKLVKSVMKTVTGSKSFESFAQNENFQTNFTEDTQLSSFAQNDFTKTALQLLVAQHYQIPVTTVANNYASLHTVGDLATFIGKNGSAQSLTALK